MLLKRSNFANLEKTVMNLMKRNSDDPDDYSAPYTRPVDRAIWWFVHILAVLGMLYMMIDATLEYQRTPTVTTIETEKYPVQKVNYPAIAICSINRISRAAARGLADELMEFETSTYNVNLTTLELENMLKLMGNLYNYEVNEEDDEKLKLLHDILERAYDGYDVNRIMKRLTPKCRSILQRCSWNGKNQDCDDLFFLRRTENGYCCTFNYVRRNNAVNTFESLQFASQTIERSTNIGPEYGLSVLLNPRLNDYAYKIIPSHGFKILIYSSLEYPDKSSGGLREVLVSPKTENFLNLDAVAFYSTPDVEQYPLSARNCLFNTERSKVFHGYYSFSDCIIRCRIRDILHVCQCVPFFYPHIEETVGARVCNLRDLKCLNKHRAKWWTLKSGPHTIPFDERDVPGESQYINCNCFPSCEDVEYSVTSSSIPLSISQLNWGRTECTVRNHSVIHIYFGSSAFLRLKQDVQLYWYELMSNYGGICGLFLGVSIINVIEAIYLLSLRIVEWKASRTSVQEIKKTDKPTNDSLIESHSIYWNELSGPVRHPFSVRE